MMNQINTIKEKLTELKNLDQRYAVFGADKHKYQLNATLSNKKVQQIERDHHITLTDEFKCILTQLGNGGAGCGYGFEPLRLDHIHPPYMGTPQLLRNCDSPEEIDLDMFDLDEISGYIKLFDYGCGMETCLIVNGKEQGDLIFFDCDGRFEKLRGETIFNLYETWLDENISILRRVQTKLSEMTLHEIIDSEWELKNFEIQDLILSLINAKLLQGAYSGNQKQQYLETQYNKWKNKKEKSSNNWWSF